MSQYTIIEVSEELGIDTNTINQWIDLELVKPFNTASSFFDEEDVERMRLILNLQSLHDLNYDSIELVLHLIDQIHYLQDIIRKKSSTLI